MLAKWKIKGIKGYYFGEDKKLYKLGFFDKAKRWNETKEVKKQSPNRYRINGDWLSQRQIRNKLEMVTEEIELIKELPETPF